jgi:hypothetical protein
MVSLLQTCEVQSLIKAHCTTILHHGWRIGESFLTHVWSVRPCRVPGLPGTYSRQIESLRVERFNSCASNGSPPVPGLQGKVQT